MQSRINCMIWLVTVLMTVLFSCDGNGTADTDTTVAGNTGPQEYCIIMPETASKELTDAADALADTMAEWLGEAPQVIKENKLTGAARTDENIYRILIGMTNFAQTTKVYESLPYGAQTITAVDGSLVIGGWYDNATIAAINSCRKIMSTFGADGKLIIPDDYVKTVNVNETLSALPRYPDAWPTDFVDCGDDRMMLIFKTSDARYKDYLAKLPTNNYRFYTENTIANIHFSSYENGKHAIHTICYTGTGETRIMIEPLTKTALAPLPATESPSTSPVTLTQIGLYINGNENKDFEEEYAYITDHDVLSFSDVCMRGG